MTSVEGEPVALPVSRRSAFRFGLWGAAGALVALTVGSALIDVAPVLVLVFVALFSAVSLSPVVDFVIRRTGLPRGVAVGVLGVSLLLVLVFVALVVITALQDQVVGFVQAAPDLLDKLLRNRSVRSLDEQFHFVSVLQAKVQDPGFGNDLLEKLFTAGYGAAEGLVGLFIVYVLTLYFLGAFPGIQEGLCALAPEGKRTRVRRLSNEIIRRTSRYVGGAALVALLAGTVTALFLFSVGLGEYALPMALLVALLDLVPLVGAVIGATGVVLLCFTSSVYLGVGAAMFYLAYEMLEGYVIYPRMMRASVDMPEYATIIAVLLGGAYGGIIGALLALPVSVAVLVLVRDVWSEHHQVSGDPPGVSGPASPRRE